MTKLKNNKHANIHLLLSLNHNTYMIIYISEYGWMDLFLSGLTISATKQKK